jgi:hypothetical protein
MARERQPRHPPHLLDEYAENVALRLADQFKTDDFAARLRAIVRHCRDVDPKVRECLVKALLLSAKRAIDFANQLAVSSTTKHTVKPTKQFVTRSHEHNGASRSTQLQS